MFYKHCNAIMKHVMSFYNGKAYEFYRCPNCFYESKKWFIKFNNIELNQEKIEFNSCAPSLDKIKKKYIKNNKH